VLPEVMRSTGMSAGTASLLTTLPALCFGLFAPLAPGLARRLGTERAVLAMMLALAIGTAARGLATPAALFAGAILSGAAIGVVNVLLPSVVKRDFADRVALMTGLYTMVLSAGAAGAAGASAPLALALGSWGASLACWAAPALLAAVALLPVLATPPSTPPARLKFRGLWSDGLAWQVTLFMGFQSAFTYCAFGWLAPILRDRGLSAVTAGLVLSGSVLLQVPATFAGAPFALRFRDQRLPSILCLVIGLAGFLACLYGSPPVIWAGAALMGIGQGAIFSIALTVIVLRSRDVATAAQLSSMAQSVGYVIAAAGPLLLGLAHQWSGDWRAAGPLVTAFALIACAAAAGAGRTRYVRTDTA
jgi:CP family cyanate transporter-like MFS transporter